RMPQPNQILYSSTPTVAVDLKTPVEQGKITIQLDDTDYTALAEIDAQRIAFKPAIPLENGKHEVLLTVGPETARWSFKVLPDAGTSGNDPETQQTDAERATINAADALRDGATPLAIEKEHRFEASSNTQAILGSEADSNDLALALQGRYTNGAWLAEMNG